MRNSIMQNIKYYLLTTSVWLLVFGLSIPVLAIRTDSVSFTPSYFISDIFDSLNNCNSEYSGNSIKVAKQTGIRNSSPSKRAAVFVIGKCYNGPGTANPIDTGEVKFCVKPVVQDGPETGADNGYCVDWRYDYPSFAIGKGGEISGYLNLQNGQSYVLVNPAPYALQWWDGKNVSEQPVPVSFSGSTINCEFHFTPGGKLTGGIDAPTVPGLQTSIWLVDTTGLSILWKHYSTNKFEIDGIPTGNYYLVHGDPRIYANWFYQNSRSAATAHLFKFTQPDMVFDSLVWPMQKQVYESPKEEKLIFRSPDTSIGIEQSPVVLYVDARSFYGVGTTGDSIPLSVYTDQKFFLGRIINRSATATTSIYWYPGTFYRSQAETLTVRQNTKPSYFLPWATPRRIDGRFPKFTDSQNLSFSPILTERGQKTSLGASVHSSLSGGFSIYALAGIYSVWNVPLTKGYKRAEGWGAFGIDSVNIQSKDAAYFEYLSSEWNKYSIEGNAKCRQPSLFGCFDSTGRLVSMTSVDINSLYQSKTGPRGRFFWFQNIFEKPYSIAYSLNFLAAGRYAIVKVEPLDTIPGPFRISWYGGPENIQSFVFADDLTSLKMPSNVTWITVDSTSPIAGIGDWTGIYKKNISLKQNLGDDCHYRSLPGGRIEFRFASPQTKANVRILSLNGKVLDMLTIKNGCPVTLNQNLLNKMLLFEVNDGRKVIINAVICR